jgi:hypothetical protein
MRKILLTLGCLAVSATLGAGGTLAADKMGPSRSLKDDDDAPRAGLLFAAEIESSIGWSSLEEEVDGFGEFEDDRPLIMGAARVSVPWHDKWALQSDLQGGATFFSDDDFGTHFMTGTHLAWRDPAHGTLGAFAAGGAASAGDGLDTRFWLIGLEAQRYIGSLTLYGQGGGLWGEDGDGNDLLNDAWFVRGVARYFPDKNARLQGELAFASGEAEGTDEDIDVVTWGVRFDRKFDDRPIYWFAGYDGLQLENDVFDLTDHRFRAGVTYRFGTSSLFENDRRGVTFDVPEFLSR